MIIDASSNVYGAIICTVLLVILIWVSAKGQERWPFSCYPMFSEKMDQRHLSIFRVALDQGDNGMHWWKPEFHRLPRAFDNALRQTMNPDILSQHAEASNGDIAPDQRALFELIASGLSKKELKETVALVLVRRRLQRDSKGNYALDETPVLRLTIAQLRGFQ